MKLALAHRAIVARLFVGSPVLLLVAVPYPRIVFSTDQVGSDLLGCLDALRPPFENFNSVMQNELIRHAAPPLARDNSFSRLLVQGKPLLDIISTCLREIERLADDGPS